MNVGIHCYSQDEAAADSTSRNFSADVNLYFIPDDFFVLPIFRADREHLHLEARYNYEDLKTFSGWAGYNFTGDKKIEYVITPMVGIVTRNSNGMSPGLEFTFVKNKFELYRVRILRRFRKERK